MRILRLKPKPLGAGLGLALQRRENDLLLTTEGVLLSQRSTGLLLRSFN